MKKLLALLLGLTLLPSVAFGAIAFDASAKLGTGWTNETGNSTVTLSHTNGSGSNRYLLVYTKLYHPGNGDYVSAVTYAGVSMTRFKLQGRSDTSDEAITGWYLANPATGTNNIVATLGGTDLQYFSMESASYTGVAQTAPEASNSGSEAPGSTSYSLSVTTLTDNAWLVGYAFAGSGGVISAGTNTTFRSATSDDAHALDSNSDQTPTGSKSMAFSAGANMYPLMIVASIAPATAVATPASFVNLFITGDW